MKEHFYKAKVEWTGNRGSGTTSYTSYERSHNIIIENKNDISASSDASFKGDAQKHNPEDLLLSSLSACHMLWYLHFCSVNNIVVEHYTDNAYGVMIEEASGRGYFKEVVLSPHVIVKEESMISRAFELHEKANKYCFIANSVNFKVKHNPIIKAMC